MKSQEIISYIRTHFPTTRTQDVANFLNLSIYHVRKIAKEYNIVKHPDYRKQLKDQLRINRKKWYEQNIPKFTPSHLQEQLIFGSLLGDGYISKGAKRSIHYSYQEHFGDSQREYREWKLAQLSNLHFNIRGNYLRSTSHPYFNRLHELLYPNDTKTLTHTFLSQCTHPIFLASLYLDDGSLTISYTHNKNINTVYCHPSIILYMLNFTRVENEQLAKHLNNTFGTRFVVSGHPDGHKTLLKINKEKEVSHLLNIIAPYVKDIPSMHYKINIKTNIELKKQHIYKKFGNQVEIVISSSKRRRTYTEEDLQTIIQLKHANVTDQAIANKIDRTYWAIVYQVKELRKQGRL